MLHKFSALRARAKKKNQEVTLTLEQFKKLKLKDCFYCGVTNLLLKFYAEALKIKTPWMTIDRKDNALGYTPENSVTACFLCNRVKGSFFTAEEMIVIGRLLVAPKLKLFEDHVWDAFKEVAQFDADTQDFDGDEP